MALTTAAPASASACPASVRTRLRPSLRVSGTSTDRCSDASCWETAEGVTQQGFGDGFHTAQRPEFPEHFQLVDFHAPILCGSKSYTVD